METTLAVNSVFNPAKEEKVNALNPTGAAEQIATTVKVVPCRPNSLAIVTPTIRPNSIRIARVIVTN